MKENCADILNAPRQPAGRGKIARLPGDIREQLNQRLYNGHAASLILPWLNSLPPVIEILAAQFSGDPISAQNLSNWRIAGYQHWLRDQKDFSQIQQFGEFAASLSPVQRHHIIGGAATLACVRIFETLKATMETPLSPTDMGKITRAVVPLMYAEKNQARPKILKKKSLKDDQLQLMREKFAPKNALIQIDQG
jgi:hypothetical protein